MQEQTSPMVSLPALAVQAAVTLVITPIVQEADSLAETIITVLGVATDHRAAVHSVQATTLLQGVQEASAPVQAAARHLHPVVQAVEVQLVAVETNQCL